jgi:hypothetical protein
MNTSIIFITNLSLYHSYFTFTLLDHAYIDIHARLIWMSSEILHTISSLGIEIFMYGYNTSFN